MDNHNPLKILPILRYPHPCLSTVCTTIEDIDEYIRELIRNMFTTMYADNGIGLAANQVGVTKRLFVMDTSNSGLKRMAFINPEIVESSNIERYKEGCLSFPGVFAFVKRPTNIVVRALNEHGKEIIRDFHGLDAICFQHEKDHLDGITFYDHLSPLQKNMIRKKIQKIK